VGKKNKGVELNDLPPRYREQAKRKIAAQTRTANKNVNPKPSSKHGEVESVQVFKIDPPVSVEVYGKRRRPCDVDNTYIKPALDRVIEHNKLLPDDGPEYIKRVTYNAAEKVKEIQEEKTVIEFREVTE